MKPDCSEPKSVPKNQRLYTLWRCVHIEVILTHLAATLLFATQCSWLYIYQILSVLQRSDWPVAEEIDNCDTSHYKDAKISLGDRLITFQGLHVVYKA